MMDGTQLRKVAEAQRTAQSDEKANSKERVEKVIKLFRDEDAIKAIKAEDIRIVLGHGDHEMEVKMRPLSPRQMLEAYPLLRKLLLPLIGVIRGAAQGKMISIDEIFDAFGENINELPKLFQIMLSRANPNVTEDWILDHLDFALDLQLILPHFLHMNNLDSFFSRLGEARAQSKAAAEKTEETQPVNTVQEMQESLEPSLSSVGGTDGAQSTSGTN